MTGQTDPNAAGVGGGNRIVMTARSPPQANLFQHEASHLYGCPDHTVSPQPWCVMSYDYLYDTRDWCSDCISTITTNHYTFG